MRNGSRSLRAGVLAAFLSFFVLGMATPGFATGNIVKSDLKGTWRISLRGTTSCGFVSMLATMTFSTNGVGSGPLQIHGDCGDSTLPSVTFTVNTLTKTGEGTATLTCGGGCAWHFDMQVAPDRSKFNLADVTFTDTDTFLDGVAILSSAADNFVIPDLQGEWQVSLQGHQLNGCLVTPVRISAVGTLTLNAAGAGPISATLKTSCGTGDVVNSFSISGLSADGSGTAHLDCGGSCNFDYAIQVSRDRSMFNLVIVSTAPDSAGEFQAGVAIRRSTGGHITKTNLAGKWQATIFAGELDGDRAAVVARFTLNAKGVSTNVATVGHDTEGDGTGTGGTLSIATLDPDGSGTLVLPCGTGCEDTFIIQVSPDRSMFSLADISAGSENVLVGVAIHKP